MISKRSFWWLACLTGASRGTSFMTPLALALLTQAQTGNMAWSLVVALIGAIVNAVLAMYDIPASAAKRFGPRTVLGLTSLASASIALALAILICLGVRMHWMLLALSCAAMAATNGLNYPSEFKLLDDPASRAGKDRPVYSPWTYASLSYLLFNVFRLAALSAAIVMLYSVDNMKLALIPYFLLFDGSTSLLVALAMAIAELNPSSQTGKGYPAQHVEKKTPWRIVCELPGVRWAMAMQFALFAFSFSTTSLLMFFNKETTDRYWLLLALMSFGALLSAGLELYIREHKQWMNRSQLVWWMSVCHCIGAALVVPALGTWLLYPMLVFIGMVGGSVVPQFNMIREKAAYRPSVITLRSSVIAAGGLTQLGFSVCAAMVFGASAQTIFLANQLIALALLLILLAAVRSRISAELDAAVH